MYYVYCNNIISTQRIIFRINWETLSYYNNKHVLPSYVISYYINLLETVLFFLSTIHVKEYKINNYF